METEIYTIMNERESTFWWHVGMRKIIAAVLASYAPQRQDNVILDAGCGTGGMFELLSSYGAIYGIDKSNQAIDYAQRKGIARQLFVGSIAKLPFADNTFDMVFCLDVLYHQRAGNDWQTLREFQRVLKQGGLLVIREPAYNWLRGHQDKLVWTKKRYYKKELVSAVGAAGFKPLKVSYLNFFLFPLAVAKRLSEHIYVSKNIISKTFHSHWLVNDMFEKCLSLEAALIPYIQFPYGLSIMCVAKKK